MYSFSLFNVRISKKSNEVLENITVKMLTQNRFH